MSGFVLKAFIVAFVISLTMFQISAMDCSARDILFGDATVSAYKLDQPMAMMYEEAKGACNPQKLIMPKSAHKRQILQEWLQKCCNGVCRGYIGLQASKWADDSPLDQQDFPPLGDQSLGDNVIFEYQQTVTYSRSSTNGKIDVTHVFCEREAPKTSSTSSTASSVETETATPVTTELETMDASSSSQSTPAKSSTSSNKSLTRGQSTRFSPQNSTTGPFDRARDNSTTTDDKIPEIVWVSVAMILEGITQLVCVLLWARWDTQRRRRSGTNAATTAKKGKGKAVQGSKRSADGPKKGKSQRSV